MHTQIKSFYNFRIWKGFKVWQKTVQRKKYVDAHKFLENNLFTATVPLAEAILRVRHQYCTFADMHFLDVSKTEMWKLDEFIYAQMSAFALARDALLKYRQNFTPILCTECCIVFEFLDIMRALLLCLYIKF